MRAPLNSNLPGNHGNRDFNTSARKSTQPTHPRRWVHRIRWISSWLTHGKVQSRLPSVPSLSLPRNVRYTYEVESALGPEDLTAETPKRAVLDMGGRHTTTGLRATFLPCAAILDSLIVSYLQPILRVLRLQGVNPGLLRPDPALQTALASSTHAWTIAECPQLRPTPKTLNLAFFTLGVFLSPNLVLASLACAGTARGSKIPSATPGAKNAQILGARLLCVVVAITRFPPTLPCDRRAW
ncbi:hypothetical protein B0H14DRAFT_2581936 [Mycena olivaceomarginata]|nr:hypothetical protein B0H14DRAFT_2581936 [Mycena olivaceomarginata]